jgi:hypothetical protein
MYFVNVISSSLAANRLGLWSALLAGRHSPSLPSLTGSGQASRRPLSSTAPAPVVNGGFVSYTLLDFAILAAPPATGRLP